MTFDDLVADVLFALRKWDLERTTLMGHSLGGKVAMRLACRHGTAVKSLIVVDVTPKPYPILHRKIFQAMASIDAEKLSSRNEANRLLEPIIGHKKLQQFILTNLTRDTDGKFKWQVNHETLSKNQESLAKNPLYERDHYKGPTLFIRGENSPFLTESDLPAITRYFPKVTLATIPEAGHNPHIDNKYAFLSAVRQFHEMG